ncbi:MAG TPA: PKD domain-containing protein, partial [Chitinispirillaceae bacterium]|nr:PKD domain-containing protein [Chitinispirillaceae bacterium]
VATNADGSSDAKSMNIKVNRVPTPPVANFIADKTEGTTPLTVKFTDKSTNSPTRWKWDFGDSQTSTVQNPEHIFSGVGVYNVTLVATNGDGSSGVKSMNITVNRAPTPPVANFTSKQTVAFAVQFNDTSSNSPNKWNWEFGDGSTSTDANPKHTYATAKNYVVNMTVNNADGTDTASKTITVTGTTGTPKASFTAAPTMGRAPLTVRFTDTSVNAASLKWNFGDGTTSTVANPSHIYRTGGFYTAKLTATNGGTSSTASKTIYVAR